MTAQRDILKRALEAIDGLSAKLAASEARHREPIAVVGMSCRLPGGVNNPADYWSLLCEGRSGIREIPSDRWDVDALYDPDPKATGKMYTRHGGFLEQIDRFDAAFFGIAPREAVTLDPQHRLLLECAWEALEDASESPDRLVNSATGVYVGITTSDYARLGRGGRDDADVYSASGTALNAAAGRIAFTLGLQGPCMAIDTACSSSLTAAHTAVQALRARECDLALVGGVNVIASPDAYVLFSRWGMIAPGAECRTFDAGACGFVRGEGCGVLVLKRLSDAVADGSRILAVIRGSAVNQDGPSSGLSVPNGLAQAKVIRKALENAGLRPDEVGFVEAHGTGTVLGDPIEVEALGAAYGPGRSPDTPLLLGSVKPSIGHLESAAGVAGLIKLVLAVQHGELPPQRNFSQPNPRIEWDRLPVRVVQSLTPWPGDASTRIGAVSGFGFSGTNAHLIVESAPPRKTPTVTQRAQVLPISAKSEQALQETASRLAAALAGPQPIVEADAAKTLSLGRATLPYRAVVVGHDRATLVRRLQDVAAGEPASGARVGLSVDRTAPRVAFLYTGQGAQYAGMGLELREALPVFREAFDHCDEVLRALGGPALRERIADPAAISRLHETGVTQPALFAVEYALTQQLRAWGIAPAVVMGHSVGEFAAACTAGVMSVDDALRLVAERGRLMQSLPAGGGMLAVATDPEHAARVIAAHRDVVSLAALNGPRDVVLSGDGEALRAIDLVLRADGVDTKMLTVSHAFHSPRMDPILDALQDVASSIPLHAARLPLVSNLTGAVDASAGTTAGYWRRHAREPVAFEASMRQLVLDGIKVFVEVGPKPVLLGMARRFLPADAAAWIPTLRARPGELEDLLETIGALFTVGAKPDWAQVLDGQGTFASLPTYPFQRKRHWLPLPTHVPAASSPAGPTVDEHAHPLLGARLASPLREVQYACPIALDRLPLLAEHKVAGSVIVPAAAYIEMAHAAARDVFGSRPVRIADGTFKQALALDVEKPRAVRLIATPTADDAAEFELFSRDASGDGEWTSHVRGRLLAAPPKTPLPGVGALDGEEVVDVDAYQARMRAVGLDYGPSFLALSAAWRKDGEARGTLSLPATDALVSRVSVHPGMLDAAFHLIGLAMPAPAAERFYLPVGFEHADVFLAAGCEAQAYVRVRSADERRVVADVSLWTLDGRPVMHIGGLQARAMTSEQFRSAIGVAAPPVTRLSWITDVDRPAIDARGPADAPSWLLLSSDAVPTSVADGVAAGLLAEGAFVEVMRVQGEGAFADRVRQGALRNRRGVIDLRVLGTPTFSMDRPASEDASDAAVAEVIGVVQTLATIPPPGKLALVWPTRRAVAATPDDVVEPLATMLWGIAATAAAELPWLDVRLIDLEDATHASGGIVTAALRADGETRMAVRDGRALLARLVPMHREAADHETLSPPGPVYAMTMRDRVLGGLALAPSTRRTPGPAEVEIEVMASGVNFRDVLNLMDLYPGPAGPVGNECSGRVVAIGADVEGIRVGDLVTCIADATFGSHVIVPHPLVFPVPPALSIAQAAVFPIAQLTAYLSLHDVGGMRAGDRVLIHAGAGGVGLAAVHLALAAGADVLASAGSPEKREYLSSLGVRVVFDSRRTVTAEEVRAVTDGHGVDLLLNSLTGEAIEEGLRSLAPGGRFLEIGLRDRRTVAQIEAIRRDVQYHGLLLGDVCQHDPQRVRRMYDALITMLESGRLPAPRVHEFPLARANAAFRYMAKARHIGRVAVTHPAPGRSPIRSDASYLVTGGLGALGLHVAEWLAAQGAGQVLLMGRRAPSAEASSRIVALRAGGVKVQVLQGDAATYRVRDLDVELPLRGVVHAAGIVDDASLARLEPERLATALRPKADAAQQVLRATDALDLTVFFSSGSSVLGSPGQSTYAGANAFLDGLAHRLRAQGRPALSVNWGVWAGGGMAADVDTRTTHEWHRRGVGVLTPEQAFSMLDTALASGDAQVAALPIDWSRFVASLGTTETPALLRDLVPRGPRASDAGDAPAARESVSSFGETLRALPTRERLPLLIERLRREAAAVLGAATPEDLDLNAGLMEQGMDSLMAVDLSGRLGRTLGVSLPTTFAFDHPTLTALARHLLLELAPPDAAPAPAAGASASATVLVVHDDDVQTMSEAELEAELRRELDQAGF